MMFAYIIDDNVMFSESWMIELALGWLVHCYALRIRHISVIEMYQSLKNMSVESYKLDNIGVTLQCNVTLIHGSM